jgi:hypothetical protein
MAISAEQQNNYKIKIPTPTIWQVFLIKMAENCCKMATFLARKLTKDQINTRYGRVPT